MINSFSRFESAIRKLSPSTPITVRYDTVTNPEVGRAELDDGTGAPFQLEIPRQYIHLQFNGFVCEIETVEFDDGEDDLVDDDDTDGYEEASFQSRIAWYDVPYTKCRKKKGGKARPARRIEALPSCISNQEDLDITIGFAEAFATIKARFYANVEEAVPAGPARPKRVFDVHSMHRNDQEISWLEFRHGPEEDKHQFFLVDINGRWYIEQPAEFIDATGIDVLVNQIYEQQSHQRKKMRKGLVDKVLQEVLTYYSATDITLRWERGPNRAYVEVYVSFKVDDIPLRLVVLSTDITEIEVTI